MCLSDLFSDDEFKQIQTISLKYNFNVSLGLVKAEQIYLKLKEERLNLSHPFYFNQTLIRLENYVRAYKPNYRVPI